MYTMLGSNMDLALQRTRDVELRSRTQWQLRPAAPEDGRAGVRRIQRGVVRLSVLGGGPATGATPGRPASERLTDDRALRSRATPWARWRAGLARTLRSLPGRSSTRRGRDQDRRDERQVTRGA